jgi:hypothetical protein
MFPSLVDISIRLLQIFGASLVTSFTICKVVGKPFFCEGADYTEAISKMKNSVLNYSVIYLEALSVAALVYPYLDVKPHSLARSASNIAEYSLWIEFLYYAYHRSIHSPMIYKWIHATHHENRVVYPIDTIHISLVDSTGLIFTLVAPMWFVQISMCEYGTIIYIYLTGAFLSHSDILLDHHSTHHREFKCNYCFLFPIFDVLCGTYK